MDTKVCNRCSVEQSASNFEPYRRTCKACRDIQKTEARHKSSQVKAQTGISARTCITCRETKAVTEYGQSDTGASKRRCLACEANPPLKRCSSCKQDHPLSAFIVKSGWPHSRCLECRRTDVRNHRARQTAAVAANPDALRTCSVCHQTKAVTHFAPWSYRCRDCERRSIAEHRAAATPEQAAEMRSTMRRYYHRNRASLMERNWDAYQTNREQRRADAARHYTRHRDAYIMRAMERIVRLKSARVVGRIDRRAIIARDNSTCYLCGTPLKHHQITLDHVIPLARGGAHASNNLRVACRACNCRKHARTLDEFVARYGPIAHP